jgi:hypothetical protein
MATDPCANVDDCPAPYTHLTPRARRAAAALDEAGELVHRLRRDAKRGDQLARALAPEIDAAFAAIRAVELRPVPRVAEAVAVTLAPDAAPLVADLVLIVGEDAVQYGFAPRIRLAGDGTLRVAAASGPTLPELESVSLPDSYRPYLYPLPEITALIERAGAAGDGVKIAVGAQADTPAHVLGRVLLSVQKAGHASAWLLGQSERGFARAVDMRLVSKHEAEQLQRAPIRVRVRLGGYSLHVGNNYEDIPRVRTDDGLFFDLDTLHARLDKRRVPRADVSFMADVASKNFTTAVFHVAQRTDHVRLVFP